MVRFERFVIEAMITDVERDAAEGSVTLTIGARSPSVDGRQASIEKRLGEEERA